LCLLTHIVTILGGVHQHIGVEDRQGLLALSDVRHLPDSGTASLGGRRRPQPRRRDHHAQGPDAVQHGRTTRETARTFHHAEPGRRIRPELRHVEAVHGQ